MNSAPKKFSVILPLTLLLLMACTPGKNNNENSKKIKEYTFFQGNPTIQKTDIFNTSVGYMIQAKTKTRFAMTYGKEDPEIEAEFMISSGILPDIIYGYTATKKYIQEGALIPLNDLIETYGPNIKKYYGKDLNRFKEDDGTIYYIGDNYQKNRFIFADRAFWVPSRLAKEANWPVIRDFDTYINLIREYMKKYPRTNGLPNYGFTGVMDDQTINTIFMGASYLMGIPYTENIYIKNEETMETGLIAHKEGFKKYCSTLNDLWNEGLLDREIFTQDYSRFMEKIASGRTVGFFHNVEKLDSAYDAMEEQGMTEELPLSFPVLLKGVERDAYNVKSIRDDWGTGISVSCKDPVGVMKFWNRFLEEDVQKMVYWGVEKLHYYNNKEGRMKKTPEQYRMMTEPADGMFLFVEGFPQRDQTGLFEDKNPIWPYFFPEYSKYVISKHLKNVMAQYNISAFKELFSPPRKLSYSLGSSPKIPQNETAISLIKKSIDETINTYFEKLIIGAPGEFDSIWQEFNQHLSNIEVDKYLDYISREYQKRKRRIEN